MSDTEMLEWLFEKLKDGVVAYDRHEWFLDGEPYDLPEPRSMVDHQRFEELKKSGRLVLKATGYHLATDCGVEWSTIVGEGGTLREAIMEAMQKEAAG